MPESTAPHGFGHLIGLPDEHQRTAEDFEAITGQTKAGPENESGRTDEQIAIDLHTALTGDDVAQRAPNASQVPRDVGLISGGVPQQGDWAQAVLRAYDETYPDDTPSGLLATLQVLPAGTSWTLLTVFGVSVRRSERPASGVGRSERPAFRAGSASGRPTSDRVNAQRSLQRSGTPRSSGNRHTERPAFKTAGGIAGVNAQRSARGRRPTE